MPDKTLLFYDPVMLDHRPPAWCAIEGDPISNQLRELLEHVEPPEGGWRHPERPERLEDIVNLLDEHPVAGVEWRAAPQASREQLLRTHTPDHVNYIESLRGRTALLATDTTAVSELSIAAACSAAGQTVGAVEAVCRGDARRAFALVRPPGHHATANLASGFCFYNNIAVAADHARAAAGCERILIIDWDAHHGNGTQAIFLDDPAVMLFDTHRSAPFYPGTGIIEETGGPRAPRTNINVPMDEGSGDTAMLTAFEEILVPAADRFRPDLVLVSAGFDAHEADLAMEVSYEGFTQMGAIVRDIADRHAEGRLVMALEGGYNTEPLARNVRNCLGILSGEAPAEVTRTADDLGLDAVRAAIDYHRQFSF